MDGQYQPFSHDVEAAVDDRGYFDDGVLPGIRRSFRDRSTRGDQLCIHRQRFRTRIAGAADSSKAHACARWMSAPGSVRPMSDGPTAPSSRPAAVPNGVARRRQVSFSCPGAGCSRVVETTWRVAGATTTSRQTGIHNDATNCNANRPRDPSGGPGGQRLPSAGRRCTRTRTGPLSRRPLPVRGGADGLRSGRRPEQVRPGHTAPRPGCVYRTRLPVAGGIRPHRREPRCVTKVAGNGNRCTHRPVGRRQIVTAECARAEAGAVTGSISASTGEGRHTTTASVLHA